MLLWACSLASVAPGQSLMRKVAHLQVVVVKAVWGIFNNTNGSIFNDSNFVNESHLFTQGKLQLRLIRQRHENRLYIYLQVTEL